MGSLLQGGAGRLPLPGARPQWQRVPGCWQGVTFPGWGQGLGHLPWLGKGTVAKATVGAVALSWQHPPEHPSRFGGPCSSEHQDKLDK